MNNYANITKPLSWAMALLLAAFAAGCGGGGGGDPILGGGGTPPPLTAGVLTDTTRPRVTFTIPANLGNTLTTNRRVTATFSEPMAASITTVGTFTLSCAAGAIAGACVTPAPVGVVTYDAASRTAIFTSGTALEAGKTYTAKITTAATDQAVPANALAGNQAPLPAASNYVWTFTTTGAVVDATAPTVTLTSPVDLATGVPINSSISATFSEPMNPATINALTFTLVQTAGAVAVPGVVTYNVQTNVATFTPAANLIGTPSTNYTATVTNGAMDLAGLALVVPALAPPPNPWSFATGTGLAQGAVALGSASTFGIMATAAITSTGPSVINGDVSLEPGSSMGGFPPGIVNGEIHINDTVSHQARADLLTAYNYAKTLPPGTTIPGGTDLGAFGVTPGVLPPGTYTSGSTMLVNTPVTLDAGGNANAVWVFQIGSSLTTLATTGHVLLANGAQAKNVFWVPTADATIGVATTFEGTIVSGRDGTANTGAVINGRILAGAITAGTIALQSATVNVPAP